MFTLHKYELLKISIFRIQILENENGIFGCIFLQGETPIRCHVFLDDSNLQYYFLCNLSNIQFWYFRNESVNALFESITCAKLLKNSDETFQEYP